MKSGLSVEAFAHRYRRRPAKSEHCLQAALVKWCEALGLKRFLAIPNGGRRDAATGAQLKREGLRPGAPDLIFYGEGGAVMWMELKNGTGGRLSEAQRVLHEDLYHCGHSVVVVRSLAEGCAAVMDFYG